MEVMIGGQDRGVPQPGRQQRQSGFNIHTGAIPTDQCVYSAAVTKIMNSWQPSVGRLDVGAGEQNAQVLIQAFPRCNCVQVRMDFESKVRYREWMDKPPDGL